MRCGRRCGRPCGAQWRRWGRAAGWWASRRRSRRRRLRPGRGREGCPASWPRSSSNLRLTLRNLLSLLEGLSEALGDSADLGLLNLDLVRAEVGALAQETKELTDGLG